MPLPTRGHYDGSRPALLPVLLRLRQSPKLVLDKESAERFRVENEARRTLTQIILGVLVLLALLFLGVRSLAKDRLAQVAEQGHIIERFTKAIDQLGARDDQGGPKLEIRLGAIYSLERIARESIRDHWSVMEVLTAYVRANAPWNLQPTQPESVANEKPGPKAQPKPRIDVQAVLTVLGRRRRSRVREGNNRLDLTQTDLRGAQLAAAHLEGADLGSAHLEGADLGSAHLQGAQLPGAHLDGANLEHAHLEGAQLPGAHLDEANLERAHLEEADLGSAHLKRTKLNHAHLEWADLFNAHLEWADLSNARLQGTSLSHAHLDGANLGDAHLGGAGLSGADLANALNLTLEQISSARGHRRTKLPGNLHHPPHWP